LLIGSAVFELVDGAQQIFVDLVHGVLLEEALEDVVVLILPEGVVSTEGACLGANVGDRAS